LEHRATIREINEAECVDANALNKTDKANYLERVLLVLRVEQNEEADETADDISARPNDVETKLGGSHLLLAERGREEEAVVVCHDLEA